MHRVLRLLATPLVALLLAGTAHAEALPQPVGPVILTISGALVHTNEQGAAQFDLAMLEALPQRLTETETPWHEGVQQFSGPRLIDLMERVGASGAQLRFVAVNDYAASMPWSDIVDHPVILATRNNGAEMHLRDKGPLFVIYPFDEVPTLRNEVYYSRSVWQVMAIEVLP